MGRLRTRGVWLHVETAGSGPPLVLLHGFTGSGATWAVQIPAFAARYSTVAIDLLGHGRSDAPADPERYRIEQAAEDILGVLDHLAVARAAVLGYSMGGRLALFLTTAAPERLRALILESASPGLGDAAARKARMIQDAALAESIEQEGVAVFVDRWERHPMFAGQTGLSEADRAAQRAQRLAQSPRGLANSLRGMGQGAQPPLADRLPSVSAPTLLIAGARDAAYCAVAREMHGQIPNARLAIVENAGHTVHLEQPEAFQRAVLEFLGGLRGHESPGRPRTV